MARKLAAGKIRTENAKESLSKSLLRDTIFKMGFISLGDQPYMWKNHTRFIGLGIFCIAMGLSSSRADVPNRIVYQGRLSKSGISAFGVHQFKACLVTDSAVTVPWCQDTSLNVTITGDFTLVLEPPSTLDWLTNSYRLSLTVDGDQLSPADQFASVPYALVAQSALSVAGGAIGGGNLADGSITDVKIAANAAIQPAKIALSPTASLANWSSPLNPALIDPTKLDGNAPIGANTVNSNSVVDGSLSRGDIATDSFQSAGAGLVPPGAIIMVVQSACPAGYSEFTALRDRFPLGMASGGAPGVEAGSGSHSHSGTTDSADANHSHGIPYQAAMNTYYGFRLDFTSGGKVYETAHVAGGSDEFVSPVSHIHEIQMHNHGGATVAGNAPHNHTFGTANASHIPPALTVIFCQKN
jgi:hypothetical protein